MSEGREGDLTVAQWLEMMDAGAKECAKLLAEYKHVPSQPWEYLQEEIPQPEWQARLTELGTEGWELVQQTEVQHMAKLPEESVGKWQAITFVPGWLCFFKRPKVSE